MRYRKLFCFITVLCLCLTTTAAATQGDESEVLPPVSSVDTTQGKVDLHCYADALFCVENGQLLYAHNEHERLPPASITKIMTALVVLESGIDLSQTVTVSYEAVHSIERGSTHIALDEGEQVTLRDMMAAMLVTSANDASNVLAEAVGGSLQGFADMMNEKAQALGCVDTHFVNAHGLDDPEHYTSAYDMALISSALTAYPAAFEFLGADYYEIPPTNKQAEPRQLWTKQNFLRKSSKWYDENMIGVKNGYTTGARQTLVSFKRENEVTLIAVALRGEGVLGKTHVLTDSAAMLDYGFGLCRAVTLPAEQQAQVAQNAFPSTDIDALKSTFVLLPRGVRERDISLTCDTGADEAALRVRAEGETLLTIPVTLMTEGAPVSGDADGEIVEAVAREDEDKGAVALRIGLIVAGVLLGMFVLLCIYRSARIRKNRAQIRAMRERARRDDYRDRY